MFLSSTIKIIKKILSLLLISVVLISAIEIIGTLIVIHYHGKPVTSWQDYNFSFMERQQLKKCAKNYDYEAAYKLGMYYKKLTHDGKKATDWLKIAAEGNHVEANRELIRYGLFYSSNENDKILEECAQRLRKRALSEMKPENFYIKDFGL